MSRVSRTTSATTRPATTSTTSTSTALDVNIDAIALAVLAYSYSTQAVNGVPGVQVPGGLKLPAPAGPEGTTGSDGGLAHDHGAASTD